MRGKAKCPKCDHEIIVEASPGVEKQTVTCPKCGQVFSVLVEGFEESEAKWEEPGGERKTILPESYEETKRPLIASTLLALSSILGIITAFSIFLNPSLLNDLAFGEFLVKFFFSHRIICFSLIIIFSILAAIGCYFSYRKKMFSMALLGGICGVLSFGLLIVGPILGTAATILIVLAREEFENSIHGKEF